MVPLFVQDVQMQSATVSGLTILPGGAILMGFLNPITGRLLDRYGPHPAYRDRMRRACGGNACVRALRLQPPPHGS